MTVVVAVLIGAALSAGTATTEAQTKKPWPGAKKKKKATNPWAKKKKKKPTSPWAKKKKKPTSPWAKKKKPTKPKPAPKDDQIDPPPPPPPPPKVVKKVVLPPSKPAAKPNAATKAEARMYFNAAAAAYKAGDFGVSAEAFEQAYVRFPNPNIAFSWAQALRRNYALSRSARHHAKAVALFERYLNEIKRGARRVDAATALGELRANPPKVADDGKKKQPVKLTRVLVSSPTPGAEVSIDGQAAVPSPLIRQAKPGAHKIAVSAPGFVTQERDLTLVEPAPAGVLERQTRRREPNPIQDSGRPGTRSARSSLQDRSDSEHHPWALALVLVSAQTLRRTLDITMRIIRPVTFALAFATVALAPAAQTEANVVALTSNSPGLVRRNISQCTEQVCTAPGFPSPTGTAAGGAAYDTRRRGTWVTDGLTIAMLDSRTLCIELCSQQPIPLTNPNAYVTGLAYSHQSDELWVVESTNRVLSYSISSCSLSRTSRCNAPVPSGEMLTGIAVDDATGLVYYSWANFGGRSRGGQVAVATLQRPCQPICVVEVRTGPTGGSLRPLHGLGFDSCRNELWVTDSVDMVNGSIDLASCTWTALRACGSSLPNDPFAGLTVEPGTEAIVGQPCATQNCTGCSPGLFLGGGDAVPGNLGFRLDGFNIPAQATAATVFNFGPCAAPGISLPFLCGPLLVSLATPPIAFTQATGGTTGCTGTTSLPISLQSPALCGTTFHAQVIGLCGGGGTFLTNCVACRITPG